MKETTSSGSSKSSIFSMSHVHLCRLKLKHISPPFVDGDEVRGDALPLPPSADSICPRKRGFPPVFLCSTNDNGRVRRGNRWRVSETN
jgi:hypothetical protein